MLFDLAPPCRDVIMPESEVRRVLSEYDHSGDGLLSLDEFGQLVRQLAVWEYEREQEERAAAQQQSRPGSRPSSVGDGDSQAGVAEPRVVLVDGLGQGLSESRASGEGAKVGGAKAGGAKARRAGKRAGKPPKQKGVPEGGEAAEEVDEAAECSVPYAEVFEIRVAHSQLVDELQQAATFSRLLAGPSHLPSARSRRNSPPLSTPLFSHRVPPLRFPPPSLPPPSPPRPPQPQPSPRSHPPPSPSPGRTLTGDARDGTP